VVIKRTEIINTVSNIGRSLGGMVFNAVVFFILGISGGKIILYEYSWFLVIANLMVTLVGWGLKDYFYKEYVRNMSGIKKQFAMFFSGKIPLVATCLLIILFLNFDPVFKIFLALLVICRAMLSLTDPLVVINRAVGKMFLMELIVYVAGLVYLCSTQLSINKIIMVLVFIEAFKAIAALIIFSSRNFLSFKLRLPFAFLNETKLYFFVALFSFCMSRIDVYVLGLETKGEAFSYYNILLNLISVSQLVISAIYNSSIKSVYRLNVIKAGEILGKLKGQFIILSLLATAVIFVIMRLIYAIDLRNELYFLILVNVFCYCITIKYLYLLTHTNRLNYFLVALVLSFLANFIFSVIFIPDHGIKGALVANTIGAILLALQLKFFGAKIKQISQ